MDPREIRITPEGYLPRGEAYRNEQNHLLVVWQGIPAEEAEVHLYQRGPHRSLGRWIRPVGAPHPDRVEPPCRRYSPCGGCALMHLTPEGQAKARLSLLAGAFTEVGLPAPKMDPLVPSPDGNTGFRHVVKMAAGYSDMGHIRMGAFGRNSRDIIPIPDCLVATSLLRKTMKVVSHYVIDMEVHPYNPEKETGILRYAVARQSRTTREILLTLVAARRARVIDELAAAIATHLPEAVGIHIHMNDGPGNAIFAEDGTVVPASTPLTGRMELEEEVAGVRLRLGPGDFFQTNPGVADALYRAVAAQVCEDAPLVDLYCGVGGMTLAGASRAGWAIGVEELPSAAARARDSASRNRVSAEFVAGKVVEVLPKLHRRLEGTHPTVVVNPARRGLEAGVVDEILALSPARVLYVSCNPRTLARDVKLLSARGFGLVRLTPFDMFPNTSHLEALATLDPVVPPPAAAVRRPHRRVIR